MPNPPGLTQSLIRRSLAKLDTLPSATVQNAKNVVLDTLGCMIGSVRTPEAAALFRYNIRTGSAGPASIVGRQGLVDLEVATYANAVLAHILEMDDTHRTAIMHPGAPVIAAALNAAERENVSGETFLKAVVFGYEVSTRVAVAIQPDHWYKGYLSMATCGAIGAAAAAAYIAGLDESGIAQAVGLAAIQAGGLNASIFAKGDMGKLTTPASGAVNGIRSAYLVAAGMTGPETIVEGRFGVLDVWTGVNNWEAAIADLDTVHEIDRTGLKPFSCCRYIHGPLQLTAQLMQEHGLSLGDIRSIDVRTYEAAVLKRPHRAEPLTAFDAKMSIPYCLAVQLKNSSFSDAAMTDGLANLPELGAIARKVNVLADEEMTKLFPGRWPSSVTITTTSGKQFAARLDYPKGEPENPLSRDEILQKFMLLAEPEMGHAHAEEVVALIDHLDGAPFSQGLFSLLRGCGQPAAKLSLTA